MTTEPEPDTAGRALARQASGDPKSVYGDTGLIVAIVMGAVDPFFDDAMRILNEAMRGNIRLVISSLVLSEAADVIRRRIKASHRCTDESGKEREAVDAEADAAVKDLVRFVNVLKATKMADMLEGITEGRLNLAHLRRKMFEYEGRTPQAHRGNTYRHEGIGPIDWIHIALAYLAGAQAICTNDKAIEQIKNDKQYGGLEIIMLRPRHATGA